MARNSRTERNVERNADGSSWIYRWHPLKDTEPTGSYFHGFGGDGRVDWDNSILRYHREFLEKRDPRPESKNRMANVVPWLLSMSLIGSSEFAAHSGSDHISQELQAPLRASPIATGYTSINDLGRSVALGDPLAPASTDPPDRGNSLRKNLPEYTRDGSLQTSSFIQFLPPKSSRALATFQNGVNPNAVEHVPQSDLGKVDLQRSQGYKTAHKYNPPLNPNFEDEYAGFAMEMLFSWDLVDFEFCNDKARNDAIYDGTYQAENVLPLGLEVWRDKLFVTLPRWKSGIPATLATVSKYSAEKSPKLRPYPNWEWNQPGNCNTMTSVFRVQVDDCDRLWVLDSGQIEIATDPQQVCPPALFVFDLRTDRLLRKFNLPEAQIKEDSLYSNIVVDVRDGYCDGAVAYLTDVWRFGIVVYDYSKDASFRVQHHFFFPDPLASRYELHGLHFDWTDGIFGAALSPLDVNHDRTLFFHPMSSFREFAVSTSFLKDEKTADENPEMFVPIGRPRAKDFGHSSGSAIDRNGVMFFNMVTRDSVWCWDTRKEYIPQNLGVVGHSNVSLVFPNDIRVDHEDDQNVWLLSNKLPMYLYNRLNVRDVNYRIFKVNIREAITNTICDPNYVVPGSEQGFDETC